MTDSSPLVVGLNAVIIALSEEEPRILTVSVPEDTPLEGGGPAVDVDEERVVEALPTGPLDPTGDRTLELALRRWVRASAGLELGYVEQLYTFGDRFRDPRERAGAKRVISAAYLALIGDDSEQDHTKTRWRSVYQFLPWEDSRNGRSPLMHGHIEPALRGWIDESRSSAERAIRRERASVAFGLDESPWDGERVLERYEVLYELGLVSEAVRDRLQMTSGPGTGSNGRAWVSGLEMAFDHRRILATAVGRIRAKIKYRPVIFELMPETFTLFQLQRAVEALAGVRLHKQNFRRLVEQGGLVEGTGCLEHGTGGRPAELFRFRREVLLERPAPGVGIRGR